MLFETLLWIGIGLGSAALYTVIIAITLGLLRRFNAFGIDGDAARIIVSVFWVTVSIAYCVYIFILLPIKWFINKAITSSFINIVNFFQNVTLSRLLRRKKIPKAIVIKDCSL